MKPLITMLLCCTLVNALPAWANPSTRQATISKRQLSDCMGKRMGANHSLSYNDAMRLCREQLQPAKEALASVAQIEPAAKAP